MTFIPTKLQSELLHEYNALTDVEQRLTWLLERNPLHQPIPDSEATADRRVPGCPSGLWLTASGTGLTCNFQARSDSAVVAGIASFICDLHSQTDCKTLLEIGDGITSSLSLDRLLSPTRRRAIAVLSQFIQQTATKRLADQNHET